MSSSPAVANPAASGPPERRAENLALTLQEVFTVIERLRSNRQPITDAASFRQQIRDVLRAADNEARTRGYTEEETQFAVFAVVAFLDETILILQHPAFRDWPRQPLQEELYGHHRAGEVFFQQLQKLLRGQDSQELADLLEVYQLCMLLGFAGQYSLSNRGELKNITDAVSEKIRRIRRSSLEISPSWSLPLEPVRANASDPWVTRLLIMAIFFAVLTLALFVVYFVVLNSGVTSFRALAGRG